MSLTNLLNSVRVQRPRLPFLVPSSTPHKMFPAQAHPTGTPVPEPASSAFEVSGQMPVYQTSHTVRQFHQPEAEPAVSRVGQYSPVPCRVYASYAGKVVLKQ